MYDHPMLLGSHSSNIISFSRLLQLETPLDLDAYIYFMLILASTISIISFLGATFIIVTYIRFRRLRSFAFKLVTYISCSDFIFYFGKLLSLVEISSANPKTLCQIQGILINFGELASVLWSGIVAFTLYMTVLKRKQHQFEEKFYEKFKLLGLGLPFLFTFIPWVFGFIGGDGENCWIIFDARHRSTSFGLRMVMFYFPLWAVISFNVFVYVKLIKFLKTINAKISKKRITLYPLILVICWFFPTIHILQSSFGHDSEFMNALHNFSESMQGILNAIIYGMNSDVKREWRRVMNKNFGLFKNSNNNNTTTTDNVENSEQEPPEDPTDKNSHYDYDDFESFHEEHQRESDIRNKALRRDSSWELEMNLLQAQKE